ncbi:MAG: histidine kinase dimerization/phosphoacceptor domain -containing protein [Verrucomicrobiota bacterium]
MKSTTQAALLSENAELRMRLAAADAGLRAMRNGAEVAPVTEAPGSQEFSLQGVDAALDHPCGGHPTLESEARQLLESVLVERDRLTALVGSINDEVWFADLHGDFTLVNPKGLHEFNLDELDRISVEELALSLEIYRSDGSPRPAAEAPPLRALTGEIICGEHEIVRTPRTGELRHRRVSAAPVRDAMGQIIGSVSVRDITDFKQAEELIKEALAEKEVMLREIHHRVKNNLQIISSLVSLQSDTVVDAQIREVLGDVRDRVRAMALVHEKLYQTGDLARLNFADYAASLLQYLWRSHGAFAEKVRLQLAVASVALPIEAAVPCGLILNELVGNVLKHAFPNGGAGEVWVVMELEPADEVVSLRVVDNGCGLPPGLDWRHSNSLGLRLVQMLVSQLRGTVTTGAGPGTEFQVTFSLKRFHS